MLATSVTTCAAFVACAVSPIWDIQCFGVVVSAVMVFADYLLVITFLPAACIVGRGTSRNSARTAARRSASSPHRSAPRRRLTTRWTRCDRRTRRSLDLLSSAFYGSALRRLRHQGQDTHYLAICCYTDQLHGRLEPVARAATSATDWFVSDHPYTLHDKATKYKFLEEANGREGECAWLVAGIDNKEPWELTGGAHPACIEDLLRRDARRQELHRLGEL